MTPINSKIKLADFDETIRRKAAIRETAHNAKRALLEARKDSILEGRRRKLTLQDIYECVRDATDGAVGIRVVRAMLAEWEGRTKRTRKRRGTKKGDGNAVSSRVKVAKQASPAPAIDDAEAAAIDDLFPQPALEDPQRSAPTPAENPKPQPPEQGLLF